MSDAESPLLSAGPVRSLASQAAPGRLWGPVEGQGLAGGLGRGGRRQPPLGSQQVSGGRDGTRPTCQTQVEWLSGAHVCFLTGSFVVF